MEDWFLIVAEVVQHISKVPAIRIDERRRFYVSNNIRPSDWGAVINAPKEVLQPRKSELTISLYPIVIEQQVGDCRPVISLLPLVGRKASNLRPVMIPKSVPRVPMGRGQFVSSTNGR